MPYSGKIVNVAPSLPYPFYEDGEKNAFYVEFSENENGQIKKGDEIGYVIVQTTKDGEDLRVSLYATSESYENQVAATGKVASGVHIDFTGLRDQGAIGGITSDNSQSALPDMVLKSVHIDW